MTLPMVMVLAVTALAIVLFITEWVRFDIVGLIVLLSLALVGVITHEQALQGFSNPAVITIASVLVLSGGLSRTGVANLVGRHVLTLAGDSQARDYRVYERNGSQYRGSGATLGNGDLYGEWRWVVKTRA